MPRGVYTRNPNKKRIISEETKRKLSLVGLGRKHSEETKIKIRKRRLKNPIRYWLGKKRPDISVKY